MKLGQRYMDARALDDVRSGHTYRPEHWPDDYEPAPGSIDHRGIRSYFNYLRMADGVWVNMPSPGTHNDIGPSEYEASLRPKLPQEMTLAELYADSRRLHQEAVEQAEVAVQAARRYVDAERTYARYAPWLMAVAAGCFIAGILL